MRRNPFSVWDTGNAPKIVAAAERLARRFFEMQGDESEVIEIDYPADLAPFSTHLAQEFARVVVSGTDFRHDVSLSVRPVIHFSSGHTVRLVPHAE